MEFVAKTVRGSAARNLALSIALCAAVASCSTQPPQPPPMEETHDIIHNIDTVVETVAGTEIRGWAFVNNGEKSSARESEIFLILRSGDVQGMFPSEMVFRPDVSTALKNPALDESGFVAVIMRGAMAKGTYRVGLLVKQGSRRALQFTQTNVVLN